MISHANNPAKPSQLVSVPHLFTPNEGPYIRSGSSPNSPAPRPSSSLRPPSGAPKPAPPPTSRQVASVTADLPLSTRLICPFYLTPPAAPQASSASCASDSVITGVFASEEAAWTLEPVNLTGQISTLFGPFFRIALTQHCGRKMTATKRYNDCLYEGGLLSVSQLAIGGGGLTAGGCYQSRNLQ